MARAEKSARATLVTRLRERRAEIEAAVLTRVYAIADPGEVSDPLYAQGLRASVCAALDYGFAVLEHGSERSPPLPTALLSQARLAARNRISLDTVLRRYFAGYALLGDFIIEEAEKDGLLGRDSLQRLMRSQAATLDRFVATVTDEYAREKQAYPMSSERRRAEKVERLLAGELPDASELPYRFDAVHLAAIAVGTGVEGMLRELSRELDCALLVVHREEETVWAWLGAGPGGGFDDVERLASRKLPERSALALGEPGEGLEGWRLTHRQAEAAFPIALRDPGRHVRYADVALLASMLGDELLVSSLRQLYLAPLGEERDGGCVLRETLRAYFAADRNAASAAAALCVTRQTVNNRLRAVEERLGRLLGACAAELEAALRLEEMGEGSQGEPVGL